MAEIEITRVGIVGAGVMGAGMAQVLAIAGYEAVVRDLTPTILDAARDTILNGRFGLRRAVELGKLEAEPDEVLARIRMVTELDALAEADLIIEAIPEKLDLKQRLFGGLDATVRPDAVFASNTSGFPIVDVSRDVSPRRQERFAGFHCASPVPVMKMCEIVRTPQTSPDTLDALHVVAGRMGKVVSSVRDTPGTYGFILNRIFAAAKLEADRIVADGIATPADVDKAMINGRNWPVGFYGHNGALDGWINP